MGSGWSKGDTVDTVDTEYSKLVIKCNDFWDINNLMSLYDYLKENSERIDKIIKYKTSFKAILVRRYKATILALAGSSINNYKYIINKFFFEGLDDSYKDNPLYGHMYYLKENLKQNLSEIQLGSSMGQAYHGVPMRF